MKLDIFVPFGRPPSSQAIVQVITEFVDSNNQNRSGISKAIRLFLQLKIACHNAHMLNYLMNSS